MIYDIFKSLNLKPQAYVKIAENDYRWISHTIDNSCLIISDSGPDANIAEDQTPPSWVKAENAVRRIGSIDLNAEELKVVLLGRKVWDLSIETKEVILESGESIPAFQ